MNIGTLEVGWPHPCAIIAELGNAANGKFENAVRLLDAVKAAGASAAKLQCYSADELVALRGDGPAPSQWGEQGWTMRDLYTKAATPFAWFAPLYDHAARIGLPIFSSVFGPDSLALLESIGNSCYKIAALDNGSAALHQRVRATRKPVIVSVRRGEVGVRDVTERLYGDSVAFLLCPEGYPQSPESFQFEEDDFMGAFDDGLWYPPAYLGVSSHCLDPRLPIAAVARGAKLLEYHVQLDDEPSALEANISLTITQLKRMVADVRATEVLLG